MSKAGATMEPGQQTARTPDDGLVDGIKAAQRVLMVLGPKLQAAAKNATPGAVWADLCDSIEFDQVLGVLGAKRAKFVADKDNAYDALLEVEQYGEELKSAHAAVVDGLAKLQKQLGTTLQAIDDGIVADQKAIEEAKRIHAGDVVQLAREVAGSTALAEKRFAEAQPAKRALLNAHAAEREASEIIKRHRMTVDLCQLRMKHAERRLEEFEQTEAGMLLRYFKRRKEDVDQVRPYLAALQ